MLLQRIISCFIIWKGYLQRWNLWLLLGSMSGDNLHKQQPLIFYSTTTTEAKKIILLKHIESDLWNIKKIPSCEGINRF